MGPRRFGRGDSSYVNPCNQVLKIHGFERPAGREAPEEVRPDAAKPKRCNNGELPLRAAPVFHGAPNRSHGAFLKVYRNARDEV
jgi:hypothetical protein